MCLDIDMANSPFKFSEISSDYYTVVDWMAVSENSRKLYVTDLASDVHCNFLLEALMNTASSYEAAYWLERISYNCLI